MKKQQRYKKHYKSLKALLRFNSTANKAVDLLPKLKNYLSLLDEQLKSDFTKGTNARQLVLSRSIAIDNLLIALWKNFQLNDAAALIAVGGYGRKELHPFSDIDLLILFKSKLNETQNESIEQIVSLLWDCGLKVGQAVRKLSHCIKLAKDDVTVATNIMESRALAGNTALFEQLKQKTSPDKIWRATDFFKAKTDEQKERYQKFDGTSFDLEPNLKSSPGGLRDIHLISWIAQRTYYPKTLQQLIRQNLITKKEYYTLIKCQLYIWRVRYALHLVSQKPEDRLLFDYQKQTASLMGYKDSKDSLAVEKMMKRYYRCALIIRNLSELLLQLIGDHLFTAKNSIKITPIDEHFQIVNQRIDVIDRKLFIKKPSQLLKVFQYVAKTSSLTGITAPTLRAIRAARYKITPSFRNNTTNKQLFVDFWSILHSSHRAISLMKRSGVLADYLEAFRQITGQMQYDMFHSYTVDEHTLFLLKNLCAFANPEFDDKFPVCSEIMQRQENPEVIFLAGLFHDIAKGRGGDHSELGALEVKAFCKTHPLSKEQATRIEWLVANHLCMSMIAQKRDISDPKVIQKFAELVINQENLELLYLLTVADIRATSHSLWNSWKGTLLKNLYFSTSVWLSQDSESLGNLAEKKRIIAKRKLIDDKIDEEKIDSLWSNLHPQYFSKRAIKTIIWQTKSILNYSTESIGAPKIVVEIKSTPQKSGSEFFVYCKDKINLFAVLTAVLNQHGLTIQVANIYTDKSGFCHDSFYVLDENEKALRNKDIKSLIKEALVEAITHNEAVDLNVQKRLPRQIKYFSIPTKVDFYKDEFTNYTRMELTTREQAGVLASIGQAFVLTKIRLHDARITTFGEKVEDTFIISQLDGSAVTDKAVQENIRLEIKKQLDN